MKVRIVNRPSGCINGKAWPARGETINLPDSVADGMIRSGTVEKASASAPVEKEAETPQVETATAPVDKVETRAPRRPEPSLPDPGRTPGRARKAKD